MSASYPSSAKSFTTKLSGDTVQAAHVNDLQEEVRAVEVGLISGLQHHLLFTDNTYDIGASGATRPRNVYIAQGILAGGAVTVGAGLIVSGTSLIAGHLTFTDDTYDIGASGATRPRNLYLSQGAQLSGALTVGTTVTIGGVVTAASQIRAGAYHSTTQSLSDSTWSSLSMNSEDYDVGSVHDTATNNSRMTIPSGGTGFYLVTGAVGFAASGAGVRGARIAKNGSVVGTNVTVPATGTGTTQIGVQWMGPLSAGDYVEVQGYQSSGGALNAGNATREGGNQIQIVKLW